MSDLRQPDLWADPADLGLWDEAPEPREEPATGTIQERFERFHELNPWVYTSLAKLARDMLACGQKKVGIGMLFEVLRWHHHRSTTDPASEFKLNNVYRSRYARLLMEREPDLAGAFETRELKAD